MHFEGIIIAVASFAIIGLFHPVVIRCEYYIGARAWPAFAVLGALSLAASAFIENHAASAIMGVLGCAFFWSILELRAQEKRVARGWFPKNPDKKRP